MQAVQTGAAAGDTRSLLMSNGPNCFNLQQVRYRAVELARNLEEVTKALRFNPGALKWDHMLEKFSVVNMQICALREHLKPLLKAAVVHPRCVPSEGFGYALTQQLSSVLTPEAEAAKSADVAALTAAAGLAAPEDPKVRYARLHSYLDSHNDLLAQLCTQPPRPGQAAGAGRGGPGLLTDAELRALSAQHPLDVKSSVRTDIRKLREATETRIRETQAKLAPASAQKAAAGSGGVGAGSAGRRRPRDAGPGLDSLLLMSLTGEGARPAQRQRQ